MERLRPAHDLERVKTLLAYEGTRRITRTAMEEADRLGWSEIEIAECVRGLEPASFYKSMESERVPGQWQDVYRPIYRGIELYVKVSISEKDKAVVLSFKPRYAPRKA